MERKRFTTKNGDLKQKTSLKNKNFTKEFRKFDIIKMRIFFILKHSEPFQL